MRNMLMLVLVAACANGVAIVENSSNDDSGVVSWRRHLEHGGTKLVENMTARSRMDRILQDPDRYFSDIAPLVEEIRTHKMVEFRSSLQQLAALVQRNYKPSYVKRADPQKRIVRDIATTLISLEVQEKGIVGKQQTVDYILARIEELSAKGQPYDAEIDFLRKDATEFYPALLDGFDRSAKEKVKEAILLALRACHATGLEDGLLARAPSYKEQPYVLARILGALSVIGGDKSAAYLQDMATTGPESVRAVARSCLKQLATRRQRELPPGVSQ